MGEWFEKKPLGTLLDGAAGRWGTREAPTYEGRRWSFAQRRAEVDRTARASIRLGTHPETGWPSGCLTGRPPDATAAVPHGHGRSSQRRVPAPAPLRLHMVSSTDRLFPAVPQRRLREVSAVAVDSQCGHVMGPSSFQRDACTCRAIENEGGVRVDRARQQGRADRPCEI